MVPRTNELALKLFIRQLYQPIIEILGPCLDGSLLGQEYNPQNERFPVSKLAQALRGAERSCNHRHKPIKRG